MSYANLSFDDRLNNALLKSLWLQRDIADFISFNSVKFSPQFITDYNAAYQAALLIPTDENLTDMGTQKTAAVMDKMEAARNFYQKRVKYFLEEAFSTQMGTLNSFGYNDYQNIRSLVSGMISFLTNLEVRCTQEKNALLAVGIAPTIITDIQTTKNELVTAYTEQQTFFGSQKDMTQTRHATFDAMDVFVRDVCRAGKTIYEGVNDVKYSDYVIYQTRSTSESTTQTINANTESPVIASGMNENVSLQVENVGNVSIDLYVNDKLETNATAYTLAIAATSVLTTNALSVGGYGKLIARNTNPIDGKVKIKVIEVVE